jgi:hypothetical protein
MDRGAHAPSRVVAGAFAGHISESYSLPMECVDAIGEGANCDTRGRVCSPARFALCSGEDLGHSRPLAIFLQPSYIVSDSGRAEDRFRPSRPVEESPNTRGRDAA